MLSVASLTLEFGGVVALKDVRFSVDKNELFAILGPNGAGKTSLFNCLSGLVKPKGSIQISGKELIGRKPHEIADMGIARTFQNLGLFGSMTVTENILVGSHLQITGGALGAAVRWPAIFRSERQARRRADELTELMALTAYRDSIVETLPYGIRKRVEIAKAVASNPTLLLLDEPVAGMNHDETETFVEHVLELKKQLGLTIILIEHDVAMVMRIADRILALDFGEVIGLGTPAEIQQNERVIAAYLGATDDTAAQTQILLEEALSE
jgi:branched-chain amino acid transport system ATP-binding protein